jgi:hypothetical protein
MQVVIKEKPKDAVDTSQSVSSGDLFRIGDTIYVLAQVGSGSYKLLSLGDDCNRFSDDEIRPPLTFKKVIDSLRFTNGAGVVRIPGEQAVLTVDLR